MTFEYKVIPAPTKGQKAKGVKTAEERFAFAVQELMNGLGADGWEYVRADTLPSVERAGLTGSTTEWRNLLVFRRARVEPVLSSKPSPLPRKAERASVAPPPVTAPVVETPPEATPEEEKIAAQDIDIPAIYAKADDEEWDEVHDGPRPAPNTDPREAALSMMRDKREEMNASLVNLAQRRSPDSSED